MPAYGRQRGRSGALRGRDARCWSGHGFPGRADFHGTALETRGAVFHGIRVSCFEDRRDRRTVGVVGITRAADRQDASRDEIAAGCGIWNLDAGAGGGRGENGGWSGGGQRNRTANREGSKGPRSPGSFTLGENEEMTSEDAWQLLENSRKKIDEIDVKLVELLSRRAGVVEDVASAKLVLNKEVDDPSRREQVLAHARAQNAGPLSNEELTSIFERIIDKMSDHQVARLKTGRS